MRTKTNFEKCAKPAKQNHNCVDVREQKKAKQTFSNHVGCHQVTLHLFQFVQSSTPLSRNLEQMQKRAPRPNHRQRRRRLFFVSVIFWGRKRAAKLWANGTNFRAFSIRLIKSPLLTFLLYCTKKRKATDPSPCYCPKGNQSTEHRIIIIKKEGGSRTLPPIFSRCDFPLFFAKPENSHVESFFFSPFVYFDYTSSHQRAI